jgi:hypothetical protein
MYESRYEGVLAQVSKVLPITNAPLEVLDRYPVAFTGKGHIEVTTLEGRHAGEVVAIKGKFLVYRSKTGKELKALQLSNVPSHFIRTQATQ